MSKSFTSGDEIPDQYSSPEESDYDCTGYTENELEDFWDMAESLESEGELNDVDYAFGSRPEETKLSELKEQIYRLIDEEYLRIKDTDLEVQDNNESNNDYVLKIDGEVNIHDGVQTKSNEDRAPSWQSQEILRIQGSNCDLEDLIEEKGQITKQIAQKQSQITKKLLSEPLIDEETQKELDNALEEIE